MMDCGLCIFLRQGAADVTCILHDTSGGPGSPAGLRAEAEAWIRTRLYT